ncbi:MAG: helix-turn-helix transcriptional regulator [Nocardioidaceae bacterium]|nr:helix-turn-helix transcriptional regulator [Nocardioidaceae bacterium]
MNLTLMAQRVLRDVEVVSRAGLDVESFFAEAMSSLERAVPHVGACVATVDPTTWLLTSTHKYGDLRGRDEHDHEWGVLEYGEAEDTSFGELARRGITAVGMHAHTDGETARSTRMDAFMQPYFGYSDELRVVLHDRGEVWGGVAMFRETGSAPFDEDEVALLAALSQALSAGTRAGLLATLATTPPPVPSGPAVIIVGSDDTVQQLSAGAEVRVRDLMLSDSAANPTGIISSLVGAARRFAAGQTDRPPRCRVRSRSGMWLVLHATPLSARGDSHGDVVVTIDEARPPEIVPLVVAAFDLTPREREITQLVLQGVDTKEMASTLHLSAYTVQDHLKSIFTKADVGSRRELIARIYFDQYVPRMGTDIGPTGWFATTE